MSMFRQIEKNWAIFLTVSYIWNILSMVAWFIWCVVTKKQGVVWLNYTSKQIMIRHYEVFQKVTLNILTMAMDSLKTWSLDFISMIVVSNGDCGGQMRRQEILQLYRLISSPPYRYFQIVCMILNVSLWSSIKNLLIQMFKTGFTRSMFTLLLNIGNPSRH